MSQPEIRDISVDEIIEPGQNIRSAITREYLDELSDSIRRVGVLQPLVVVKKNEKYEIVAGVRRFLASRQAGLLSVPCIVQDYDGLMVDLAKVHENLFREDVSPIDEARYYKMLVEKYQYDIHKIANMVSRSVPYVEGRLEILKFPEDVLVALDSVMVSLSVAREFAKIPDPERRKYFLDLAIQSGITAETARQWRYQFEIEKGSRAPVSLEPENPAGVSDPVPLRVVCQGCQQSVDINYSRVLYLCVKCHDEILKIANQGG